MSLLVVYDKTVISMIPGFVTQGSQGMSHSA